MINEVFKAIFDRVSSQITQDVFDHVPENHNNFPFVRIDPPQIDNNDDDSKSGFSGTIQIVTYSRNKGSKGSKEAADIALNIYNAIHRFDIPDTTNYSFSTIHQIFSNILVQDDGLTRHSVQRFQIIFETLV